MGFCHVAKAGLELNQFTCLGPSKCLDYSHEPPRPAPGSFSKRQKKAQRRKPLISSHTAWRGREGLNPGPSDSRAWALTTRLSCLYFPRKGIEREGQGQLKTRALGNSRPEEPKRECAFSPLPPYFFLLFHLRLWRGGQREGVTFLCSML